MNPLKNFVDKVTAFIENQVHWNRLIMIWLIIVTVVAIVK